MANVPPPDWDDLPPPPDLDFALPDDPFPQAFFSNTYEYLPEEEPFEPLASPSEEAIGTPAAAPIFESDAGWGWHDAAIIAVERLSPDGVTEEYGIGALDVFANANTGDLGGSYREIGTFTDLDEAAAFYHELQGDIHAQGLLPFQLGDYAVERAPTSEWRAAADVEYAAYDALRSLDTPSVPDVPPEDFDLDTLFVEPESASVAPVESATFRALREIGLAAEGFDPDTDPPPFIDPETGTAYWIGVFQPDKHDPDNAVTSILSLGRDPETGEVEAQLAPIVPGEWDKAYGAAEYLLNMVEKGGLERALEAAEGMALAADQRDLWAHERGIPLEPDAAQNLADYTRDQWEIEL